MSTSCTLRRKSRKSCRCFKFTLDVSHDAEEDDSSQSVEITSR